MKKDLLTRQMISKDLKKMHTRGYIWGGAFLLLMAPLIYFIIHYLANLGDKYYMSFSLAVACVSVVLLYFIVLISVIHTVINIFKIKNGDYEIVTDRLIKITEKVGDNYSRSALAHPYYLHFSRYGKYVVPYENNHEHSEMFCMNDEGLINYATEGDDFFLVVLKKQILAVYNKKLFDFEQQK